MYVIVVDDEVTVARAVSRILASKGHNVRTVSSALECLAAVAERSPNVVLTDLEMPGMSGNQLAEALSAINCPARTYCMTSCHETVDRTLFLDVLKKPFDAEGLSRFVASW